MSVHMYLAMAARGAPDPRRCSAPRSRPDRMDDAQARAQAQQVESLLAALERLADSEARVTATTAVQAVVELYGDGRR